MSDVVQAFRPATRRTYKGPHYNSGKRAWSSTGRQRFAASR